MVLPRPSGKKAAYEVLGIKEVDDVASMTDDQIKKLRNDAIASVNDTQWPEEFKQRKRSAIETAFGALRTTELRDAYKEERHKELYADLEGRLLLGDGRFVKDTALQEKVRHHNNEAFEKQYKDIEDIIKNRGTRTPAIPSDPTSPAPVHSADAKLPSTPAPLSDAASMPSPIPTAVDSGWGRAKVEIDTGMYEGRPCVRMKITGEPHEVNAVLKSYMEAGYNLVKLKDQEKKQEAGPESTEPAPTTKSENSMRPH